MGGSFGEREWGLMRSGCQVMVRAHGAGIGMMASEGHHVFSSLEFLQLAAKEREKA
jgi:hypothetical protein